MYKYIIKSLIKFRYKEIIKFIKRKRLNLRIKILYKIIIEHYIEYIFMFNDKHTKHIIKTEWSWCYEDYFISFYIINILDITYRIYDKDYCIYLTGLTYNNRFHFYEQKHIISINIIEKLINNISQNIN